MAKFSWPDWLPTAPEAPPPPVDADRIEAYYGRAYGATADRQLARDDH